MEGVFNMNKNKENNLKYTVIPVGRAKDIRGQKFGRLTVVDRVDNNKSGTNWLCECECGNKDFFISANLVSGDTKSCGCLRQEEYRDKALSYVGVKFNDLTVVKPTKEIKGNKRQYLLRCVCGTFCYGDIANLNNGNKKSCGCLLTGFITKMNKEKDVRLEKHPRWITGLTDKQRLDMYRMTNKDSINNWRNQVYQRDNHTCQLCNNRGGTLNAHHLNAWNAYPDERFDIDNGITLCTDCHTTFHKEYGYGNNTKEQFNEYLNTIPTLF